jgi:hypothetical protein
VISALNLWSKSPLDHLSCPTSQLAIDAFRDSFRATGKPEVISQLNALARHLAAIPRNGPENKKCESSSQALWGVLVIACH